MDAETLTALLDDTAPRLRAVGGVFDPVRSLLVVILEDDTVAEIPLRLAGEPGSPWPQVVGHA